MVAGVQVPKKDMLSWSAGIQKRLFANKSVRAAVMEVSHLNCMQVVLSLLSLADSDSTGMAAYGAQQHSALDISKA